MSTTDQAERPAARSAAEEGLRGLRRAVLGLPGVAGSLRALKRAGLLPRKVWGRLKVEAAVELAVPGGGTFRYQVRERDCVGQGLYWEGLEGYEPETMPLFMERVRTARRFVDVGAFTGLFSLVAAAASPTVRVAAIEALPSLFERLRAHVALNGWEARIELFALAAAERDGEAVFHVPEAELTTQASLAPPAPGEGPRRGINVRTARIDGLAESAGWGPVDLVKIDVEGAEPQVLAGMRGILTRDRPAVILEVNPGGPREAIEAILGPLGYRYAHLGSRGPVPVARLEAPSTEVHRNFLCTVEGRA